MKAAKQKFSLVLLLVLITFLGFAVNRFWNVDLKSTDSREIRPRQVNLESIPRPKELPSPETAVSPPKAALIAEAKVIEVPVREIGRQIPKDHVEFEILGENIAIAFGDIILGRLESEMKNPRGLFKPPKSRLWTSNIIPFAIREGAPNAALIAGAIQYFNQNTAVQFVPLTTEKDGIIFEPWNERRCASYVGTVGGLQPIFIGPGCGTQEVIHEIMHALGFVHEQSRTDRDQHVRILWENIMAGFENQFDKVPDVYIHPYTGSVFNFDYESAMLYRPESFAKTNELKTIEPTRSERIAPTANGLSARDLERVHLLYGN